jgi:hypothetical protein
MRIKICVIFVVSLHCLGTDLAAQNLVRNGSFEKSLFRLGDGQRAGFTYQWNSTNSLGLLYHNKGTRLGGYRNLEGYQLPHTGTVYASIVNFDEKDRNVSQLQTRLTEPLLAGHEYYIEYYVSRADYAGTPCEEMDAFFSTRSILSWDTLDLYAIEPSVHNPNGIITDSVTWTKISDQDKWIIHCFWR